MFCPTLISPACIIPSIAGQVAGAAASSAAGGVLAGVAGTIQSGIAWVVSGTIDWWIQVPSVDLTAEPAVGALQQWLLPITVAVAVLAVIAAAGKMALTRKANPLIDVGSGLAIIAATSAVGVLLPAMLLKAGDAWSSWVLTVSTGGQFKAQLTSVLTMPGAAPGVVIVLGIIAIIMSALQAVLMLFRQAAVVILAGVLPLAAAGTLAPATRAWFRRVTGWMLALIFYKPAAAAVYATAFTMIGTGKDPRTILMGFAMVLLSLLALPVLMKFFTWTTGAADSAAGAGIGFLGTMLGGAVAVGALRGSAGGSGGLSAADQARMVSAQLGQQGGGGPQRSAGPSGSAPPGGAPTAPASGGTGSSPGSGSGSGPAIAESGLGPAGRATGAGAGSGSPGGAAASAPAGAGAGGTARAGGTGAAAGAGMGAAAGGGAAARPVGIAATGLASGAAQAGRQAAGAMRPDEEEG
jgi:hypothetical protein